MGYPYPNFCFCAFWGPYSTRAALGPSCRRGGFRPLQPTGRLGIGGPTQGRSGTFAQVAEARFPMKLVERMVQALKHQEVRC